ncbi:DUF5666 domain-containing protein [[Mycobacterium] kokjensenii]|uniref:DUF5666 domain-containing protein n=1 Tax=[Mycobacterium] kokjensenii TaxID=3064287 RepID=A0ABM9LHI5_9MYCO|nr:DUF5666 domain-containing protein [Mycolicibacter sp. MU0083]CAJ1499095.1 DUF5666 domain-containing protein [Mycolicibacter sp. MU0083]
MSARPSTTAPAIRTLTGAAALFAAGALFVPALAHADGDRVIGPVSSTSGNTFEVARPAGTAVVAYTDATKIFESVPAQRAEITVGTCIKAGAGKDSAPAESGAITAKFVAIKTDGNCEQRPADPAKPAKSHRGVRGVVESVSGDTVTVAGANGPTTVTIDDNTHVHRLVTVSGPSISTGKCVAARGANDDDGVLQAKRITVWAPGDGQACPEPPM